jgi:LysM repeat protein
MRTAEDIIKEYQERGYDAFRIRAIATLRPEPMRSEILALLNQNETIADDEPANGVTESADIGLTTPSQILAAIEPDGEDLDSPREALVDTVSADQANAEEEIYVEVDADTSDAESEDVADTDEEDSFWEAETDEADDMDEEFELVGPEASGEMPALQIDTYIEPASETMDIAEVISDAAPFQPPLLWTQVQNWENQNQAQLLQSLQVALNTSSVEICRQTLASAVEKELMDQADAEVAEDTEVSEAMMDDDDATVMEELPAVVSEADESVEQLVSAEDLDDTELVDTTDDDSNILYAFDNEEKLDTMPTADLFRLVNNDSDSSEWVDCGSGLIMMPKSMNDAFTAYNDAISQKPLVESSDDILDASLESIESLCAALDANGALLDELIEQELTECADADAIQRSEDNSQEAEIDDSVNPVDLDAIFAECAGELDEIVAAAVTEDEGELSEDEIAGIAWESKDAVPADTEMEVIESSDKSKAVDDDNAAVFLVEAEVQRLEEHLHEVEKVIAHKDEEVHELRTLLGQKDEIINVQQSQIEEERSRQAEHNAEYLEIQATEKRLTELTEEITCLRIDLTAVERERNILKTETIPAFEEQQLSLVEVMEEEVQGRRQAEGLGRRLKRRLVASYTMAAAASVMALLVPVLGLSTPLGQSIQDNGIVGPIQLAENDVDNQVADLMSKLDRVKREKNALHQINLRNESKWKRREAVLLSERVELKNELASSKQSLAVALTQALQHNQQAGQAQQVAQPVRQQRMTSGNANVSVASITNRSARSQKKLSNMKTGDVFITSRPIRSQKKVYVVKSGDVFSEIVKDHYGTANRRVQKQVAKANGIDNPNRIGVGQTIRLVAVAPEDD